MKILLLAAALFSALSAAPASPGEKTDLQELFRSIAADPKTEVEVNLPEQKVTNKATGRCETFEINAYKKHCLMNGLDDIDFLVENKDKIAEFENRRAGL